MSKPVAAAVDDETDESFERIFGSMGANIEEARLVGLLSSWPKGEKRQKKNEGTPFDPPPEKAFKRFYFNFYIEIHKTSSCRK